MDPKTPSPWLDLTVSMVSAANETKTFPASIGEVFFGIRSGKWAKPVGRVRARYAKAFEAAVEEGNPDPVRVAKDAVNRLKSNLPGITFSGAFKRRANEEIEHHSGLLCIDCDNCQEAAELRANLALDPHIQAAFISPTGTGVKALVRICPDAATHVASFFAVEKYFLETYTVTIDKSCKDVSRLCYVAHDPDVFIREDDATIIEPLKAESAKVPEKPQAPKAAPKENPTPEGLMMLPKDGLVTNSASAASIFKKIIAYKPPAMFVRGSSVVTIEKVVVSKATGQSEVTINDMSPEAFISDAERYGTLFAWRSPRGDLLLTPDALMSIAEAKMLLACRERSQLPPLAMIHNCPLLVERDGKPALDVKSFRSDDRFSESVYTSKLILTRTHGRLFPPSIPSWLGGSKTANHEPKMNGEARVNFASRGRLKTGSRGRSLVCHHRSKDTRRFNGASRASNSHGFATWVIF